MPLSSFIVLGAPAPGLPARYQGTERNVPSVGERTSDTSRTVVLEALKEHDLSSRILDIGVARQLATVYRGDGDEMYEVIELTEGDAPPSVLGRLLGYDITSRGGLISLLASILLWSGLPLDRSESPAADPTIKSLRDRFLPGLNDHALFPTADAARDFLTEASRFGNWEGPELEWEVVGVWAE